MAILLTASLYVAIFGACRESRVTSRCAELYARDDFATAATVCGRQFDASRQPEAGLLAARSAYRLGRSDEVLQWPERLTGTPQAGTAWVLVGLVREQQRDDAQATSAYLKAVDVHRGAGDARKTSDALYRLFHVSWRASAYRDAFAYATRAFEEAAKVDDRALQLLSLEALFTALYEIGDIDSARLILSKTEGVLAPEDHLERARLLMNRGVLFLAESRPALARAALDAALRLSTSSDNVFLIRLRFNLAEAALLMGNFQDAERHLTTARQLADQGAADQNRRAALAFYGSWLDYERGSFDDAAATVAAALGEQQIPEWQWVLQFRLGRAEEARGHHRAATTAYRHAIDGVEQLRASVANDEFKDWLVEQRRAPIEALFALLANAHDLPAALHVAERAKARAFNDAFVHNASALDETRTAKAVWSYDAASDRLDALARILPAEGESVVAPLPTPSQIVRSVGDRHVLFYFQAAGELWLLKLARGTITARSLGKAADIEHLVEAFARTPDDSQLAAALGVRLVPADWLPRPGSMLYVVPDRALGTIPFAALRVNGHPVIQQYAISYLPSVSAIGALASIVARPSTAAVVIGDPRTNLPGAFKEAEWVASRLGVTARTHAAATRHALAEASNGSLLHVAAHTWLAPGGPWLELADGRVSASTIMRQRIRPAIAILASCSGAATRGTGYWGSWGAAFLAAGTPSVVATLWPVDDAASREFIMRFYEEGGAVDPARALSRTQRVFFEAGKPPSFWAPFVHMGIASRSPAATSD
jgi:tetratricopeptide (TPR) repeat protein